MHATRFAPVALSIALAASLLAGGAAAGSARLRPRAAEPARFQPRAAEPSRFQGWAPLSDYVAAGLGEGGTFRLTLPTRAGNVEVALHPSTVHATGYHGEEVAHGARRGRALPRVRTFAGSVAREGEEAAVPRRGGDFARLALEPGGRVSGLLRVDGVLYDLAAEAAAGDLLLHVRELTPEELGEALAACGAQVDEALAMAAEAGSDESGGGPVSEAAAALREIELGTEADAPFVAQTGGVAAANAKILSIVNSINGIYEFDLGLTNRVVFQRAWNGSDPYSSGNSDVLLNEFRSRFLADVATVTDDAQLFSGRDFEGSTVGYAFVSSACGSYRFGVNQYYQQSDSLTRLIVAHEMGHNLGGSHTPDGIMAASINPNVTWFSSASKSEIASYVGRVACLAEVDAGGPPVLEPIGPQSVSESQTLALQLEASDPDGDPLVWSALPLPAGASLSPNGAFSWRPGLGTVGCGGFVDRSVTFSATDLDGNRASETVVISVLDAPSGAAPVLADPADRSVTAGQALSIPLSASDPDGDGVSFSAAGLPNGASLSAAGQFGWTPQPSQVGSHSITFTATDCTGRSASQSVSIDVATNAPVLAALSAASGSKGDLLTLTGQNLAGKKVKVWFGPRKAKARDVTATSLVVKVPKRSKKVIGDQVTVTVVRDGIPSVNALTFTWLAPTP
jgi:hypothetical protein